MNMRRYIIYLNQTEKISSWNTSQYINNNYSQRRGMKGANNNFKESQTTVQFLLGPIKIKDGLFIGDQFAAKDIQFIISNKVTHVINTVSKSIPNLYQRFGIQYLSVHWTQKQQNIFDKKNNAVTAIFQFVEQAMQAGESCLIHSMYGKSRASAVIVAYLMKKYNWSLNKCLEFINSKKEGLEIRNNYLSQMQDLQKRIMNDCKLSLSWNQIKNEEDLILANTFYNSKKIENKIVPIEKKIKNKKVVFAQKLVQKTNNMSTTHTAGFHMQQNKVYGKKLRSILKGDGQFQKDEEDGGEIKQDGDKDSKEDPFISSINGNIVHVTVNNFITTDKRQPQPPQPTQNSNKFYNTRPFSSDGKDRERRANPQPSKIHPSDSSMSSTLKNPYEAKLMSKIGSHTKTKKKEQPKNLMMIYDRPLSAKVTDKRTGKMPTNNPISDKLGGHDLLVTNSSTKKRYPSSNHREDPYKWK